MGGGGREGNGEKAFPDFLSQKISFYLAGPTDVAFKIGSQIMREKVAIGKTL